MKKYLALVLLVSLVGVQAAEGDQADHQGVGVESQSKAPDAPSMLGHYQKHSFATLVGAGAGAGTTLYSDSSASLISVGKNAFIGAAIANSVVGADRAVANPQWLPQWVKKPVLISGGVIALYLATRK